MKLYVPLLVTLLGLFSLSGCGGGDNDGKAVTSVKLDYHVIVNSLAGLVKITYKDSAGQLVVEDGFAAKTVGDAWSKQYEIEGPVDALLKVELAESSPPDPVGVEFYIALDGTRVQKATKFITKAKGMTLKVNRP
ncbi:MAG TPA: hypothetical protein DGR97_07625 [Gammaproteobacteria bacterium]|nr:hypothetical protein [Gammaproteobacteria bacterium]|tara:strand:- start:150 stop:554 length:405 start_codon:yes stop_codon:yes gene_type:complete